MIGADITRQGSGFIFKGHNPEEWRTQLLISFYHEIVDGRQRKLRFVYINIYVYVYTCVCVRARVYENIYIYM
jgi:hypothetical protein